MQVKHFNKKNTIKFIYKIRDQLSAYRIDLVCDNARWYKGKHVKKALLKTKIHEHRLPPYSPQMNACEYFIRCAKEILSSNFFWKDLDLLTYSFRTLVTSVSRKTKEVFQRCKPKMFGFNLAKL